MLSISHEQQQLSIPDSNNRRDMAESLNNESAGAARQRQGDFIFVS